MSDETTDKDAPEAFPNGHPFGLHFEPVKRVSKGKRHPDAPHLSGYTSGTMLVALAPGGCVLILQDPRGGHSLCYVPRESVFEGALIEALDYGETAATQGEIDALRAEIADLRERLGDPGLREPVLPLGGEVLPAAKPKRKARKAAKVKAPKA